MNNIIIRTACYPDIIDIAKLFYDTVQCINVRDYSQNMVDAWSSGNTDSGKWKEKISQQFFIVAMLENIVVGFSSLTPGGYIDFMYVHKDYQRQGIARQLLKTIEKKAGEQGNKSIYSDVSITARPFFEAHGYKVEREQIKKHKNEAFINYRMIKEISNYSNS